LERHRYGFFLRHNQSREYHNERTRHGGCHVYSQSRSNAHPFSDTDCYANTHSDRYSNADAYSNCNSERYSNAYTESLTNTNTDPDRHPDAHADSDRHPNPDADRYPSAESGRHAVSDAIGSAIIAATATLERGLGGGTIKGSSRARTA